MLRNRCVDLIFCRSPSCPNVINQHVTRNDSCILSRFFRGFTVRPNNFHHNLFSLTFQVHSQRAGEEPPGSPAQLPGEVERHRASRGGQLQAHHSGASQQGQTLYQGKKRDDDDG